MRNEYGVLLDRNGYAPSIIPGHDEYRCLLCGKNGTADPLDRHEIFGGENREKSKLYGIDYPCRPGSGEKVLVGREHDIYFLAALMVLRRRGFAETRLARYQSELCRRIRYYNKTFDGAPEMVLEVMDDKLGRYGRDTGQIPVM